VDNRSSPTVEQADRTIAAVEAGDRPAYHAALIDEGREARHADGAFETLIAFKASQGERLAVHALEVRRSTLRAAFALDGLAVLFAIAATAVAVVSLRRNVSALVQASDAAEQRSSELDQFAGRVAHDVLSPLMNVTLALHIVGKRLPPEDPAQRAGTRANRALSRVRRMVEGLLELARAGAGAKSGSSCDIVEVVGDVVEGTHAEAEARGINVDVASLEEANAACSAGVLTSVVQNLVRNAIKYMEDGERKRITIRAGASSDRVWLEVEDTGPGIAPGALRSIFEPFVRATTVGEGAGLGLATVKRLVEAHGGCVGCRSRLGEGSLFRVDLPQVRTATADARELERSSSPHDELSG
jgi:signal transduction histidine kinase